MFSFGITQNEETTKRKKGQNDVLIECETKVDRRKPCGINCRFRKYNQFVENNHGHGFLEHY